MAEQREGETDAEMRLRRHNDPEDGFKLGEHSLYEVNEAVANGWEEARSQDVITAEEADEIRASLEGAA